MKNSIICVCIVFIFILSCLTSCSSGGTFLEVYSEDYPGLKKMEAGDFDRNKAVTWYIREENPYSEYSCYVTAENGKLNVSNYSPEYKSAVMEMDNGYFVGVNLGEFDGWVRYFPYYGKYPESGEEFLVAKENFCGFVQINNEQGYVLTYPETDIGKESGIIYQLSMSEDGKWTSETAGTISGTPQASLYIESEKSICIVTTEGILLFSTEDKTITTVCESEILEYAGINSVVKLNGIYYCGSPMGIYEYDPAEKTEKCYPMDYTEYVARVD